MLLRPSRSAAPTCYWSERQQVARGRLQLLRKAERQTNENVSLGGNKIPPLGAQHDTGGGPSAATCCCSVRRTGNKWPPKTIAGSESLSGRLGRGPGRDVTSALPFQMEPSLERPLVAGQPPGPESRPGALVMDVRRTVGRLSRPSRGAPEAGRCLFLRLAQRRRRRTSIQFEVGNHRQRLARVEPPAGRSRN